MLTILRFLRGKLKFLVFISALASILSGLSRAGLIKLLNDALVHGRFSLTLYVLLCLSGPISSMIAELCGVYAINELMHEVLLIMVRQILRLPLVRIEEAGAHKLLSVLTEDAYLITSSLKLFPSIVVQASMIIGCSAYLAYLSPRAFLCLVILIAFSTLSFRITHQKGQLHMRRARRCADDIVRHLQFFTGNIKELQLHSRTREGFINDGLGRAVDAYKRPTLIGSAIYSINANWNHLMFFAVMGALLYVGPRWLSHEKPGLLTGYGLALLFLIGPITALTSLLGGIGAISAAFTHLEELGLELVQNPVPRERSPEYPGWTSISLNRASHTYRSAGEAGFSVGPLTLELKQGEILFIVGGNGSGKTTAAKLCCGLYYPQAGEIQLNGMPLMPSDMTSYRELFSVIFSDVYLFDRLFGIPPDMSQQTVNQYLRGLGLAGKLTLDIEGRLSTTALSRGQEKRVALLAACLEDRPIFIFDEWAADQDPEFKRIFYYEILPELRRRRKGVIVVSHDDRYFDVADTIIKMDYGKIQSQLSPMRPEDRVVSVDTQ